MHAGACQFRIEAETIDYKRPGKNGPVLKASRRTFDDLRQAIIYRSERMNTNTCLARDRMTSGVRFTFARDRHLIVSELERASPVNIPAAFQFWSRV